MKDPGIIAALSGAAAVNTVNSFLPPVNLVAPGVLDPRVSWARSQGGGVMATRLLADGVTWEEVAQNVPRFNGVAQNLLMEGSRTNLIRNPRGEGGTPGVVGSGGVVPTFFSSGGGNPTGGVVTVLASRSINGVPGAELKLSGNASTTGNPEIIIDLPAVDTAVTGSTAYTISALLTLTAGSFANVTNFRLRCRTFLADGTTPVGDHLSTTMFPTATQARYTFTFTTGATAAFARMSIITATAVGVLDYTIHYGAPQLERGSFFSTPILPPVGTPGVAVRGADFGTATLASLGILPNGAANIQFRYRLYTSGFSAAPLMVLGQVDDGSDNNRAVSTLLNSSLVTRGTNVLAGVSTNLTLGTVSGASLIPFDMNIRGDGTTQFVGYYSTAPDDNTLFAPIGGAPVAGLTTFRLGNRFDASAPFFGEFASIVVLPRTDSPMTLVSPGVLSSAFTTTRAHTPSTAMATRLLADGVTWEEVAQNLPRFHGVAQRLLVEGARTNGIRNPRAEGMTSGTIGAGAVAPTNYSVSGSVAGITITIASAVVNGTQCLRVGISGTAGGSLNISITSEGSQQIAAILGQAWSHSVGLRREVALGSTPSVSVRMIERSAAGGQLVAAVGLVSAATATLARYAFNYVTTNATIAFISPLITIGLSSGQTYDSIVDISWSQMEQADFPSTPILPVVGTPATTTRAEDRISATLAALGLTASGACTLSAKALRTTNTTGGSQAIALLSDAGGTNRFYFQGSAASVNHAAGRTLAGANAFSSSIAGPVAGVLYNSGLRIDGAGNASGFITGATLQTVAGGPTTGLTTFYIGTTQSGSSPYWGEIERMQLAPYIPGNSDFRRMVDTIP